jgi:hypothetical protein
MTAVRIIKNGGLAGTVEGDYAMRTILCVLFAGLALSATAGAAHAQRPFIYRNTAIVPSPYPGNFIYSSRYVPPYPNPYSSSVVTGVVPNFYGGYNAFYSTTTAVRPIYSGPYHSIIWDPYANTYRYGPGYLNSPNYSFYSPY